MNAGRVTPPAVALAAGLALAAIALAVTLSDSPVVVAGADSTPANGLIAETASDAGACQAGEALPAGTSAIRLAMESDAGPRVSVRALSGTSVLTSGAVGGGWTGGSVTIPVRTVFRSSSHAQVCFRFGATRERVAIVGERTSPAVAAHGRSGRALPGRFRVEYLRPASASWWSLASSVARRMGLGRAPGGVWIAPALLAAMAGVVIASSWLVLRELR